jgi:hypothetical protein
MSNRAGGGAVESTNNSNSNSKRAGGGAVESTKNSNSKREGGGGAVESTNNSNSKRANYLRNFYKIKELKVGTLFITEFFDIGPDLVTPNIWKITNINKNKNKNIIKYKIVYSSGEVNQSRIYTLLLEDSNNEDDYAIGIDYYAIGIESQEIRCYFKKVSEKNINDIKKKDKNKLRQIIENKNRAGGAVKTSNPKNNSKNMNQNRAGGGGVVKESNSKNNSENMNQNRAGGGGANIANLYKIKELKVGTLFIKDDLSNILFFGENRPNIYKITNIYEDKIEYKIVYSIDEVDQSKIYTTKIQNSNKEDDYAYADVFSLDYPPHKIYFRKVYLKNINDIQKRDKYKDINKKNKFYNNLRENISKTQSESVSIYSNININQYYNDLDELHIGSIFIPILGNHYRNRRFGNRYSNRYNISGKKCVITEIIPNNKDTRIIKYKLEDNSKEMEMEMEMFSFKRIIHGSIEKPERVIYLIKKDHVLDKNKKSSNEGKIVRAGGGAYLKEQILNRKKYIGDNAMIELNKSKVNRFRQPELNPNSQELKIKINENTKKIMNSKKNSNFYTLHDLKVGLEFILFSPYRYNSRKPLQELNPCIITNIYTDEIAHRIVVEFDYQHIKFKSYIVDLSNEKFATAILGKPKSEMNVLLTDLFYFQKIR